MAEQRHSRAYHRYFEGFAEREVLSENGWISIERVYVGNYYRAKMEDNAWNRQRIIIAALFAALAVFYLWAGFTTPASAAKVASILTMVSLFASIWLGIAVFHRLTAPREMMVREWRESGEQLRRAGLGTAACLWVTSAVLLATTILENYSLFQNVPGILMNIVAGGCAFGIYFLEKQTQYEILPPKNTRPGGSYPIQHESQE